VRAYRRTWAGGDGRLRSFLKDLERAAAVKNFPTDGMSAPRLLAQHAPLTSA
jgi:hypothetical protein